MESYQLESCKVRLGFDPSPAFRIVVDLKLKRKKINESYSCDIQQLSKSISGCKYGCNFQPVINEYIVI